MNQFEQNSKENIAYVVLKSEIVKLMFEFTDKYASKGPDSLYPDCAYILIDVLTACLSEA